MRERWRDVVGAEGRYQVSDLGRVRSIARDVVMRSRWGLSFTRRFEGVLLTPSPDKDGYPRVGLYMASKVKLARVHVLVATAFVKNPNNLPQVDHKDNDPTNPKASNLQWVTGVQNMLLAKERGHILRGDEHPRSRLTSGAVEWIREEVSAGATYTSLAKALNVSDVAVRNAALGITWKTT